MKKILFALIIALSFLSAYADGVAGIEWGTTIEQTESKLNKRFGECAYRYPSKLMYRDVRIGGVNFYNAFFDFAWNEGETFFHAATFFSKRYDDLPSVIDGVDNIVEKLSSKYKIQYQTYDLLALSPDNKVLIATGGEDPFNSNRHLFGVYLTEYSHGGYSYIVHYRITLPFNEVDEL